MFERLKELICDMAKFLTRLGADLILSALPIDFSGGFCFTGR